MVVSELRLVVEERLNPLVRSSAHRQRTSLPLFRDKEGNSVSRPIPL